MAFNWYLKKEYFDTNPDIEDVVIHYVCAANGVEPDWSQAVGRSMPAGEILKSGVGEVAKYGPAAPSVPQHVHPSLRKKVLKMPNEVWDPARGELSGSYTLHYYYEVTLFDGSRQISPVFTDEIATREVVVVDPLGVLGGVCANWSVYDWDAPQFSPTEDPAFIEKYGEDHELRQFKFYGVNDKEDFMMAKKAALDTLPLPHRFTARISAPVGAPVRLRFHVANWGLPEAQRWEDYWLDEVFEMAPEAERLVFTPLGTQPAAAPLTVVTPDLLVGNPYAGTLTTDRPAVEAVREAEEMLAAAPVAELVAA